MENKKNELHKLIDSIENDSVLKMVTEDIQYYTRQTDILDEQQSKELDVAIDEVDNGEVIDWKDFKKELDEWKRR